MGYLWNGFITERINTFELIKSTIKTPKAPNASNASNASKTDDCIDPRDLLPRNYNIGINTKAPSTTGRKYADVLMARQTKEDKNFMETAYNYGIDTVGSSLKTVNHQLRSDPIVTHWTTSTIEPNINNRKQFEIGS